MKRRRTWWFTSENPVSIRCLLPYVHSSNSLSPLNDLVRERLEGDEKKENEATTTYQVLSLWSELLHPNTRIVTGFAPTFILSNLRTSYD